MGEALLDLLIVDDNRAEVELVRMALEETGLQFRLYMAASGEEAIEFINLMGKTAEKPCPDVLLLNLTIRGVNGIEVLKRFRRHPMGKITPVIVMPPHPSLAERNALADLGVTSILTPAQGLDDYMKLGQMIRQAVPSVGFQAGC